MTGSHILDLLSHDSGSALPDGEDDEIVAQLAARMVANSIDRVKMLRDLRPKMFPDTTEPKAIEIANALRAEFEEWVREAEALLAEAYQQERAGHSIPHLEELRDFSGLTQAMLQVTLEDHFEARDQIRRGDVTTYSSMGEFRRELHLKSHR